jgi:hypothetical protein
MKKIYNVMAVLSAILFVGLSSAIAQDSSNSNRQKKHSNNFIDKNGDGYNDNAPDHDGDGIPNGLDPDWQKSQNKKKNHHFVDIDGDGIDDSLQENGKQKGKNHKSNKQRKKNGKQTEEQARQRQMRKHGKH